MNIELKFLQKAIQDKNYVSFSYKEKKYTRVEPIKLLEKENEYILYSKENSFKFSFIKKIKILKERF